MKTKLLSLLLVITLLAVTVSTGLPTIFAADENLITNGDFAEYSGYTPTGWGLDLKSEGGASAQIVKNEQIADGVTANVLKITTSKANSSPNKITHKKKIKIERNASYTMTFWIKVSKIKGLTTYMYEPDYIDLHGASKHSDNANEGQNIYSFTYDNGSTRVIRTDVRHTWKVAETGTAIDGVGPSMFISRVGGTNQVLTPDYPNTSREGEWMQVIHTFTTGNEAAHEAEVTYQIMFPSAVDGEVSVADFKMNVVKSTVDTYYTPAVNDETLGFVSKDVPLYSGKTSEITAEAIGENIFEGWFVDGALHSTEKTLSFTYDPNNEPKYEARFTKAAFGVDGSFETGYTNGQLLAQAATAIAPGKANSTWTPTAFLGSEKDNSGIYIDSHNDGNWRKATITNAEAHTGKNSLFFAGQYGMVGYKYAGLNKNTEYVLSVYAYLKADPSNDWAGVSSILVSPANESAIIKRSNNSYGPNNESALAYKYVRETLNATTGWTKYEITVNTKDNTDVIFWLDSNGLNAKLYLDNFAISRPPQPFNPQVNDSGLGKATSQTTNVYAGAEVTVTAESVNGGVFKGWYIGTELVSAASTYTFKYEDKFSALTAKFEVGPTTLPDYSFETTYPNNHVLAQSPSVSYSTTDTAGNWTPDLFLTSSKDGNNKFFIDSEWSNHGKATVTNAEAHTGSYSIKMTPNSRFMGYKLTGLEKNTKYTVSFYAMTKGTSDGKTETLASIIVTDANTSCMIKGSDNRIVQRTVDTGALGKAAGGDARDAWKNFSVRFETKDSTDVIVWMRGEGGNTSLYIDDLTLAYTPKEFKPESNNSGLGSVTPQNYVQCSVGQSVTVTATPFPNVTFTGWYVGDVLKSTDAEFTFAYDDSYQGLTAVFVGTPGTIPNGGFEYYQNGQVLASYSPNNTPQLQNNAPWAVDASDRSYPFNISVTNERAHTGEKSGVANVPYRLTGLDINGLEPNTQYIVSFYAYITGAENPTNDLQPKVVSSAFVFPKGKEVVIYNETSKKYQSVSTDNAMGKLANAVDCWNKWKKVEVVFNTTEDATDVTLWINFSGQSAKLYMDDFSVYKGAKVSASADLGGTVTTNSESDYVALGSDVTFTATPYEGNTFAGWFDAAGNLVSESAAYTFTVNEATALTAKFDGYNKPATNMFAINGLDGTFENGTVPGWIFYDPDPNNTTNWCSAIVSNAYAYEGSKSLQINGRYRNTILPLTGLSPNADYRISFYVLQTDTHDKAQIASMAVIGENDNHLGTAGTVYAQTQAVDANSGWNKVDIYFNPGSNTAANLIIRFNAETISNNMDKLYMDNLSLYRYSPLKELQNGSFDDNKINWLGDGTVVTDANNKVISLNENESVYQNIQVSTFSAYTVSFKAKGKLTAAAQDLSKIDDVNVKGYLSSKSYVDVDGSEWTEYSYKFFSGVHKSVNIAFKALADGAMVDDVKVTKEKQTAGSIIEHIDFDTERFDFTAATDTSIYSLYTATSENDPYVYSGNRSLKYTYNELLKNTSSLFNEAYLSYQPGIGNSLKVTMKLKIANGKEGGFVGLAPEYTGNYGGDTGFEHMAKNSDWQTISFYVNNTSYAVFKAKINSIAGNTAGDFYVDDIVIEITPPMVMEENAKITYCERLYNAVDNEGFENAASAKDWANLPSTAKIVKGNALKGDYFLRVEGGTHYVLPVAIEPNKEYYFAASIRGSANTVGTIGITLDNAGTEYYLNRDDEIASVVKFDSSETGWKRSGFKFTTDSDVAYLTIDVKAGALEIDSVMMFTSEYGYRFDPNDYTKYVPYDYDNLKSPSTVINGGFGDQPYYKGPATEDGSESPSTGDSIVLPVITIVLAVLASAVLMLIRKRKEGAENA